MHSYHLDPGDVLEIFDEVGVNQPLYFLVFGESILKDGIVFTFYQMMDVFTKIEIDGNLNSKLPTNIVFGVISFFTIGLGGIFIGVLFGILSSLITKHTKHSKHTRHLLEPLVILLNAYLAYLWAEMLGWSGIFSMISCGVFQAQYAFKNLSTESISFIDRAVSQMASIMDSAIFLYLGIELCDAVTTRPIMEKMPLHMTWRWDWWFVIWTIVICFVVRFVAVFFVSWLTRHRDSIIDLHSLDFSSQVVMSYAGLRGAMSFCLASLIHKKDVPAANMFKTTTHAVILTTVFLQGATIRSD